MRAQKLKKKSVRNKLSTHPLPPPALLLWGSALFLPNFHSPSLPGCHFLLPLALSSAHLTLRPLFLQVASPSFLCGYLPPRTALLLYEPSNWQTVMRLSYHNIMRLQAPKLKEAIFYSCQLIIEEGPTYSGASKGSRGERGMEVMERSKGAGFEKWRGRNVGSCFTFNIFLFPLSPSLSGISVWSLAQP